MKFTTSMGHVHLKKGAKVGWTEEDNCHPDKFVKTLASLAAQTKKKHPTLTYVGFQVSRVAENRLLIRLWVAEPGGFLIKPFSEDSKPQTPIEVSGG